MNLTEVSSYEEAAINAVVSVINRAKEKLGERQTLKELAKSREFYGLRAKVSLTKLKSPLECTSEQLIRETIEKKWHLTQLFKYSLKYRGITKDECSQYHYFEAIFSQPTTNYPIPQATVSVFFRVGEKLVELLETRGVPMVTFRIEGHHQDHDIRYVVLTQDWILGVLMMKIKTFRRIEQYNFF